MAMPTIKDALDYMGIDYADAKVTANAQRALITARAYLHSAVGDDVEEILPDDPKWPQLVLMYADDLYSERGASAKVSGATRAMVAGIENQLRQELARARVTADEV